MLRNDDNTQIEHDETGCFSYYLGYDSLNSKYSIFPEWIRIRHIIRLFSDDRIRGEKIDKTNKGIFKVVVTTPQGV